MNTIGKVRLGKAQVNESSNNLAIDTRIRENRTNNGCQLVMLLTWSSCGLSTQQAYFSDDVQSVFSLAEEDPSG